MRDALEAKRARNWSRWPCAARISVGRRTRSPISWSSSIRSDISAAAEHQRGHECDRGGAAGPWLAAAAGLPKWIKLEIHPDPRYLLPDPVETLLAAEQLVKEGFVVLPYINADPVLAKRLQDVTGDVATVMPLGSPIGSNRGIQTRDQIRITHLEQATVPVVVDAGIGAPSQCGGSHGIRRGDAVLVNTAIAVAAHPNGMANAFKLAVEAGRAAYMEIVAGGLQRPYGERHQPSALGISGQVQ